MDVSNDASEGVDPQVSLKALILKAWRERWTEIQWGINIKTILPRGVSGDLYNLSDCILQQALVGCGANQLVISYLRHSLESHLVSYAAVLQRIAKFDSFHKPHCILSLLEFLEGFLDSITCRGKMEEEMFANAVSSIILWLLQVYHYSLSKYPSSNPIQSQELLEKSTLLLNAIVNTDFLIAMFYLAKQSDPNKYIEVSKKCQEITAYMMMNTQFKVPITIHETLQKICNLDLDRIAPLNNKPEIITHCVQALIAVDVTINPSMDIQKLSSQLLVIQRIKNYSLARLYCELIRACFISLNDSSKDSAKQALWAAFTFLKLPQVIQYLHNMYGSTNSDGEYSMELVEAFELLLQCRPLLDIVDTKNSCNSIVSIMEPMVKLNIISEERLSYFRQKRDYKDNKLQKLEPIHGLKGSVPLFITRAEPTLQGILKTMGGDYSKTLESLYVMLCQTVAGTASDTILAIATVEGKLKLFVSKLIKFNEFALLAASEKGAPQSRVYIFDMSFLILCSIVQDHGVETVLEENGDSFFEQWVREFMVHNGVHKSPDQLTQKCDPQIVDTFIHNLTSPDFKNTNLKPHELCMNVSVVIREILTSWEQGCLSVADVKRMLDSIRQKMACLAVCASIWLCSYINVGHQDAILKPLNMIQQFLTSPTELELSQLDNFKERAVLMYQIIRKMLYDVHPPSAPKSKVVAISHNIISRQPILEQLLTIWNDVKTKGYLHIDCIQTIANILNTAGHYWLVSNLVKETLKYRYLKDLDRSVDIVLAIFHLDIEKCTETLLTSVLSDYLYNINMSEELVEPQASTLAKLCVYSIYAALEHRNCNESSLNSRKRRHDDDEDMDICPLKSRRLNDNSSDSSLFYTSGQSSSSGMGKKQLFVALETLYQTFSQLAGKNGCITPQTHFVFQFLMYIVHCGQEKAQIVLQKMPSDLVPTLIKALPDNFNISIILRFYDLCNPKCRKNTERDLCLMRNMRLRPE